MDQVSESLISDLASGATAASQLELTEEQKMLGIPVELIYIAGILVTGRPVATSTSMITSPKNATRCIQEQFSHMCDLYRSQEGSATLKNFLWSPRIQPSTEQKAIIERDVHAKLQVLQERADRVLRELLETGEKEQSNNLSTRDRRQKKNRKSTTETTSKSGSSAVEGASNQSVDSQQDTLGNLLNLHLYKPPVDSTDNDSWIQVATKNSHATPAPRGEAQTKPEPDTKQRSPTRGAISTGSPASYSEIVQHPPKREHEDEDNNEANTRTKTVSQAGLEEVTENNVVLARQVRELERKLQEEREKHLRIQRVEKERHDDLVQALQLRLYISETRLKSYQDALDQHVNTVAANVYTPSSPPKKGRAVEGSPHSSPLISKLLKQRIDSGTDSG